LTRPAWDPGLAGVPADLALQNAVGRYCCACERPLPEGGVAWDAETGEVFTGPADAKRWPELFVLCRVCAAAAEQRPGPTTAILALPDRHLTFTLADPSSVRYELQTLVVRGEHEAGVERVIVVPTTPAAAETVRRFALNTPFHRDGELVAPLRAVEAFDWRLLDRTRAWRTAEDAADRLQRSPSSSDRALLSGTVARLIEALGCWSVWATVLWDRLGDPEILARLLLPPRGRTPVTAAEHAFPATRDDWLPPAPEGPNG
jgi:hypothetical protein